MIATIYTSILSLYSAIADLTAEHPKLTGMISIGAVLAAAWAYWKRPIINARLGEKEGSYAPVPTDADLKNTQGAIVGRISVKYFRVRIRNAGLTTIKDCGGQLIKVTRRVAGKASAIFDTDPCHLGWAHHSQSDIRAIPRGTAFQMDIATLVLQSGGNKLFIGGLGREMPSTLVGFLHSYTAKATYTLDVLISADNARPRKVPIEIIFDPEKPDLDYIAFNTRYPWWRLWWWLRAQWSRRSGDVGSGAG